MTTYYVLDHSSVVTPCRIGNVTSVDDQDLWWNDGVKFTKPIRTPITLTLEPYNPDEPEMSPMLASMYFERVLFFTDALIAAMEREGVTNLDTYEARILDPDSGQWHTNYKAVNILGLVGAADMKKSVATVHDGIPLVDVSFDKLVIDPNKTVGGQLLFRLAEHQNTILVHERVKQAVLAAGITDLQFYKPGNIAI